MEFTYYQILGISHTATDQQIKVAFKSLAKKYHPDKNSGNPAYEEHFKKINAAYQTLSDPDRRKRYDLKLYYRSQKTPAASNRPPVRKKHTTPPQYSYHTMKKPLTPLEKKKQIKYVSIAVVIFAAFITAAFFFYNYMNSVTALERLEEGKIEESRNRPLFAMESYSAAIGYDDRLTEAYVRRADLRIKTMKDYEGAARDYSHALKDNQDAVLYFKRAKCYLKIKNFEEVMSDLNKAIALNPKFDTLFYYRGEVNSFILERYDEAIRDYDQAIALNKNFTEALFGKALALQHLTKYESSIREFDRLIRIKPDEGSYYYYRGYSKVLMKDSSGACNDWALAEKHYFQEAQNPLNEYCR